MLEVRLLGKFAVHLDGEAVKFPSRAEQSLLGYLILKAGTAYRREKLAGMFWPESDESNARGYLRLALWRVRKKLKEISPQSPDYFIKDRVIIAFNDEVGHWLDVDVLEREDETSIQVLMEAVDVYQGELLPGFYDEWAVMERERVRMVFERKMQTLINCLVEEKRWREVLEWGEHWLAKGQTSEAAYRALMQAHWELGDHAGMANSYQRCVKALKQDLDVEPSEQTKSLYEALCEGKRQVISKLSKRPSPPDYAAEGSVVADRRSKEAPDFLQGSDHPSDVEKRVFVGREKGLAQLHEFLERALDGSGQIVFVIGEAGSGKTSLLYAFARHAQKAHRELIVAKGNCDVYTGAGNPYLPFRDILNILTGDVKAVWENGLLSRERAIQLWHLLPDSLQYLMDFAPDLIDTFVLGKALVRRAKNYAPEQQDWLDQLNDLLARKASPNRDRNPDQSLIFEEYTSFLEALSARQPLLLFLDDLHWSDLSSIGLLTHLSQRIQASKIMIVGAYRPEEVAHGRLSPAESGQRKQHPLEGVLSEFKRRFEDIWVDLDRVGRTEGRDFVHALIDSEPNRLSENFRRELTRRTEGHPLFTSELLREMKVWGDIVQDEEGRWVESPYLVWDRLPPRVQGVIEKRIGRLDSELKQVLTAACVEGEEFTAEIAARVCGIDEQRLVRRLSSVLEKQHRLIVAQSIERLDSQRLTRYRFVHNLFQKYLYSRLGEVERSYLHEAVGKALEGLYGERAAQIALRLARHFRDAGLKPKALYYLQKAGDENKRIYAYAEAIASYRQALELISQNDESGHEQLISVYTKLGRALELNSQFDEALGTYKDLEKLACKRNEPSIALVAMMARVSIYATPTPFHDPARGKDLAEKALSLARDLDDRQAEANTLWRLANACFWNGNVPEAIDYAEQSIVLARKHNLRELLAFALNDLGNFYVNSRFERAKATLREARELWRELENQPMLTDSLSLSSVAYSFAGEYDQGIAFSEEAWQICQTTDNLWGKSFSRMMVGYAYWELGQPNRAMATAQESIYLSQSAGFVAPRVITRANLALIYASLGTFQRGLEAARRAIDSAEEQFRPLRVYPLGILARVHLWQDNLQEAEMVVEKGKKDRYRKTCFNWFIPVIMAEVELLLKQGNYEKTIVTADRWLTNFRKKGMRTYLPQLLHLRAKGLLALGQEEAAYQCLLEARREAETIGSRRTLWRILFSLSQIGIEPDEAEKLRRQASRVIEYIADHIDQDALRASFLNLRDVRTVLEPDPSLTA